jgi:hypothetical protein
VRGFQVPALNIASGKKDAISRAVSNTCSRDSALQGPVISALAPGR